MISITSASRSTIANSMLTARHATERALSKRGSPHATLAIQGSRTRFEEDRAARNLRPDLGRKSDDLLSADCVRSRFSDQMLSGPSSSPHANPRHDRDWLSHAQTVGGRTPLNLLGETCFVYVWSFCPLKIALCSSSCSTEVRQRFRLRDIQLTTKRISRQRPSARVPEIWKTAAAIFVD
jgi:hypothetical protein